MTLLQLRNFIQADVPEIIGSENFPDTKLNQMINFAQREVQRQLSSLGLKRWIKQTALTAPADSVLFGVVTKVTSMPTTALINPNSVFLIDCYNGATYLGVAKEINLELFKEIGNNLYLKQSSKEFYFVVMGSTIHVTDSGDIMSDLTATHEYIVPDLSADNSSTEIPSEFEEFIIKKVVYELKQDAQKQAEFNAELSNAYSKFVQKSQDREITNKREKAVLQ